MAFEKPLAIQITVRRGTVNFEDPTWWQNVPVVYVYEPDERSLPTEESMLKRYGVAPR